MNTSQQPPSSPAEAIRACTTQGVACAVRQMRTGLSWIRQHPEPGMIAAFALGFLIGVSASRRQTS